MVWSKIISSLNNIKLTWGEDSLYLNTLYGECQSRLVTSEARGAATSETARFFCLWKFDPVAPT